MIYRGCRFASSQRVKGWQCCDIKGQQVTVTSYCHELLSRSKWRSAVVEKLLIGLDNKEVQNYDQFQIMEN